MTHDPFDRNVTLFTIGHSNHPLETFLTLIGRHEVGLIVDVRSSPYSRYAAHFNREAIRSHLQANGIDYLFLGDPLGGRPRVERFYDHEGYVLYGLLAQSPSFLRGLERLGEVAADRRAALLCGEEDPTDCHRRRLLGRVLRQRGVAVLHIRGDGRLESEEEVARAERLRKTQGQLMLFDLAKGEPWRSTRPVCPGSRRPSDSPATGSSRSGA